MTFPDRISGLIAQLEAGKPLTHANVQRAGQLQALDLAKIGEDFARETIARNKKELDDLQANENAKRALWGAGIAGS